MNTPHRHRLLTLTFSCALLYGCSDPSPQPRGRALTETPTVLASTPQLHIEETPTSSAQRSELKHYLAWFAEWSDAGKPRDAGQEEWIARLESAALLSPASMSGVVCRTQLIALQNELGLYAESEEQVLRQIEHDPQPRMKPFWISELSEVRLQRVERSQGRETDLEESLAIHDRARRALKESLAQAGSLTRWSPTLRSRYLGVLHGYRSYAVLGQMSLDQARVYLTRGEELSRQCLEAGLDVGLRTPELFAVSRFELLVDDPQLDAARLRASFEELRDLVSDRDLLALHYLRYLRRAYGERTLGFAERAERWLHEEGIHGPNGLLVSVYAGQAYLANEEGRRLMDLIEPTLGLEPEWLAASMRPAWRSMQSLNALAYTASAMTVGDGAARDFGVDYLLALGADGIDDEQEALVRTREFLAQQRRDS